MKKSLFIIVVLTCVVLGSSQAFAYDFIRPISLQNNTTQLSNYQIALIFDTATPISENKLKSDCSDLRFLNSDRLTLLNHWVESGCNSSQTTVWVKVPSLPANQLAYIYMVYGDATANDISNSEAVFDFIDDFEGNALNTEKWKVARNDGLKASVEDSALHVQASNTQKLARFIINSNYKFNRDVRIDWRFQSEFNLGLQLGHLVKVGRMYINSVSDVRWTTQTWNANVFELYNHQQNGALGCDNVGCYPSDVSYIPVGNAWKDSDGQQVGPLAESLGISVVDILGNNAYYQNAFWIDWIRVRSYTPIEPSYFIENEEPFVNITVSSPPLSCDAEVSTAYDQGYAEGLTTSSFADLSACQASLADSQSQIDNLQISVDQLIMDNTQLAIDFNACGTSLYTASDKLAQCQDDLDTSSIKFSQCQGDLDVSSMQFVQCQSDLGISSTQFSQCQIDLGATATLFQQCETALDTKTVSFQLCQTDLSDTNKQYQFCQADLGSVSNQYQQCSTDLVATAEKAQQCQENLDDADQTLSQIEDILTELETKLSAALPGNAAVNLPGNTLAERITALSKAVSLLPKGQIQQLVKDLK